MQRRIQRSIYGAVLPQTIDTMFYYERFSCRFVPTDKLMTSLEKIVPQSNNLPDFLQLSKKRVLFSGAHAHHVCGDRTDAVFIGRDPGNLSSGTRLCSRDGDMNHVG